MNSVKLIFVKVVKRCGKILSVYDRIFKKRTYQRLFRWSLINSGVILKGESSISPDISIDLSSSVSIGHKTTISYGVTILTHDYSINKALVKNGVERHKSVAIVKPVSIGDNSFIGAKSIILPGTQIGDNVIIGAGTVVKGIIPDNVVVAGNPCRIIRSIDEHFEIQEKYNKEYFQTDF